MYIEQPSKIETGLWLIALIVVPLGLFLIMAQPLYRSEEMIAELQSDCDKRGGVMLKHEKTFSTSYSCTSRLDGK